MRRALAIAATCLAALPALAEPLSYRLDPEASKVTFTFEMNGDRVTGRMPIRSADITIDFDRAANSSVTAAMAADEATTPLFFATSAMKSPEVLDTANHPEIVFESTSITAKGRGAAVEGLVTIRGVTRPLTLQAQVFRPRGTELGDRREIQVLMTGEVNRNDFGASGYPSIVAPGIVLEITARLSQIQD